MGRISAQTQATPEPVSSVRLSKPRCDVKTASLADSDMLVRIRVVLL